MSLLPYLLQDSYPGRPSRLLDQHFGLPLDPEDLLQPLVSPRMWLRSPAGYLRNWQPTTSDSGSIVNFDKDKFQASLDVSQFKPEEITVKVTGDNTITVEGKHEEKEDEHGYISRHFVRRYILPKNANIEKVDSKLSTDGVLTITAPSHAAIDKEHKEIPITHTGKPAKQIKDKKDEEK